MPLPLRHAFSVALLIFGFGLATFTRADADLWGHTRYGLDMLRDHELPSVDPYSFTQDKPWINHEWLAELQMGAAYTIGGAPALALLKAVLILAAFVIAWRALDGAALSARLIAMLVLAIGTIHVTSSLRPQVWSFLLLAILCRCLTSPRPRAAWWIPLLFVVWANSHGGWLVGFGVLGLWAAVDTATSPDRRRQWLVVVPLSLAATLANPYGAGLWRFLADTVRPDRNIMEWGPLWSTPWLNWVPWSACIAGLVWLARSTDERRWPAVAVMAMLAVASARVLRIESLFVVVSLIFLAKAIANRWPAAAPGVAAPSRVVLTVAAGAVVASMALTIRMGAVALACVPIVSSWGPDVAVMPSLRHAQAGRLVTFFDWGQYALWHLSPRLRVSMDGRRETIYSDRRLAEHDAIVLGTPLGLATLADWQAEYVWLPDRAEATRAWLENNLYRIDVATDRSFVAVRADLPLLPPAGSGSARACFPE